MKIKKVFLLLLVFLTIIMIEGCTFKPKNYIEILDETITVNMGSSVGFKYKVHGEVTNINIFSQNETIAKYSGGTVIGVKMGETKLFVEYDQGEMIIIPVTVIDKIEYTINLQDRIINDEIYNEFTNELSEFNKRMEESNNIINSGYVKANSTKESFNIKISKSPFYYEEIMDSKTKIIAEEKDKLFSYLIEGNSIDGKTVKRSFVSDNVEFDENKNIISQDLDSLKIQFNSSTGNITREGNVFTLVSHYKDAVIPELEKEIKSLCKTIGLSYDEFGKTVTTRVVTIDDEFCSLFVKMNLELKGEFYTVSSKTEAYQEFSLKPFKKIDIYDGSYKVLNPDKINEVTDITNLNDLITLHPYQINMFLIKAKKGMLVIEDENNYTRELEIELYDLNGNLVSLPVSKNNRMSSNQLKTILVVPEDNDYYISINSRYDSDANIKIKNYEYSTLVDFENNYKITEKFNYEGIIEGKYDFESFEYENESPATRAIYMKNTGESIIYFVDMEINTSDTDDIKILYPGDNILINVEKGKNVFFICNDYKSNEEKEKYNYSIEFDIKYIAPSYQSSYLELGDIIEFKETSSKYKYYIIYLEKGTYYINSSNANIYVLGANSNITIVDSDDDTLGYKKITIIESKNYIIGFSHYTEGDTIKIIK